MRDLADITIKFKDLEDVDFDVLEEFLNDEHIKYEVIDVKNLRTEGDFEPDPYDEWHDRMMLNDRV